MAGDPGEDPRLTRLDESLRRAREDEAARTGRKASVEADPGHRLGSRVLSELLGGLIGGALFGWLGDRLFGTSPWLLLLFLALGVVVAFRNIFRITSGRQ